MHICSTFYSLFGSCDFCCWCGYWPLQDLCNLCLLPLLSKILGAYWGFQVIIEKFVKHYAIISKPLTNLLKKSVPFVWTADTETSFQTLKQALVTAPVLALPDFSLPFSVETDTCGVGIGAVLSQNGHPLAYVRKALGPKTRGLSTYEKEYMAIILAV